jgi:hypothetical protein
MAEELINMSSQFKGLPMGDLIGGPLTAACDSQIKLAHATADFIFAIGFRPNPDSPDTPATRTAQFKFKRPVDNPGAQVPVPAGTANVPSIYEEEVELEVPLLAIVKVPNLSITTVDITFDMEVKSSFSATSKEDLQASMDAEAKVGWGVFSAKVSIHGSVATHKENTRSSDNSAKYHVSVHAEDTGMPEGLARVLDILQTACAPRKISAPVAVT